MQTAAAEGQLYIVSAPSGAGKTSLLKALLDQDPHIRVSTSHTTRDMRPGEQDGQDYHYVTLAAFEKLIEENAFIEHARVFDNYYGTAVSSVAEVLEAGNDLILEIDWQGAQQVRQHFPHALSIFILPPSKPALQQRLSDRGQDEPATIKRRMNAAISEMSHYHEFEYLIINDDFDLALRELETIVISTRLRQSRQFRLNKSLIEQLIAL